jgi:gliding motility-associated-like protein
LSLSANSDIPQNIFWSLGGTDTVGTGPSIIYSPPSDTTIFAIVTDGGTCSDTASIFLDGYFFEVEVMAPDAICPGEPLSIEAINNGTDSLTYLWGPEECIISGADTPTPEINTALAKDVFLTVTNPENGCTKEFTIPLTISELDLNLTADPESEINRGETVDITAESMGDSLQWAWSNGETTETITVQPEETTTYNVQVTDANGCEVDGTIIITVIQPVCDSTDVFIPSGFSPNGDGVNDVMVVRSNFIMDMQLDVYNRWGELVFNTADPRTGWNGQFDNTGEELHSDTYAYCLKVTCTNDLSYTMLGNITLVR